MRAPPVGFSDLGVADWLVVAPAHKNRNGQPTSCVLSGAKTRITSLTSVFAR